LLSRVGIHPMPVTQQDPVGQHALTVVLLCVVLLLASCMKGPALTEPQPTIVCSFKTHVCTPVTVSAEIMTDVR
jgi:hypothetical protein